jgi:hypothetical protein
MARPERGASGADVNGCQSRTATTGIDDSASEESVTMNPTATSRRLGALRNLASDDQRAAHDRAWEWLLSRSATELVVVFERGASPAALPDGDTDGVVVAFTVHPRVDGLLGRAFTGTLPWQGKRFRAQTRTGVVLFQRRARWTLRVIMHRHRSRTVDGKTAAMEFRVGFEPSVAEQNRSPLLALDYDVAVNPRLLRGLREEVVEVVPGVFLGRMMLSPWRFPWRRIAKGRWLAVGYFVLRQR